MTRVAYGLTRAQRENLNKLATYLEALPHDYRDFDMFGYVGHYEEPSEVYAEDDRFVRYRDLASAKLLDYVKGVADLGDLGCGTVACALGHGPSAGVPFCEEICSTGPGDPYPIWESYRTRFAAAYRVGEWLFSSEWVDVDNHHWGAAARIRFILAGRAVPASFDGRYEPDLSHLEAYAEFRKERSHDQD